MTSAVTPAVAQKTAQAVAQNRTSSFPRKPESRAV
jgi:hypothetical protein